MNYIDEIYNNTNKSKYADWYVAICRRGLEERDVGYTEKHHIVPKFMKGSNSRKNLTKLTGREHFIVHLLLTKMVVTKDSIIRANAALGAFVSQNRNNARKLSSRQISVARKAKSDSQKGKKFSDEHKQRIGNALRGKKKSTEHNENNRLAHTGHKLSTHSIELRTKTLKANRAVLKIENPELYKQKRFDQLSKRSAGHVVIDSVIYPSLGEAARTIGRNPDYITRRLSSDSYPTWVFLPNHTLKKV